MHTRHLDKFKRQSLHINSSANRKRLQWRFLLLLVGVFSFGFRYYYITHAEVFQPVNQENVRGDAVEYYAYARNLTRHEVFSKAREGTMPLMSDSFRDPGYPIFLAGWMKFFSQWNNWYAAVLLSQALLSALTVVLVMGLGRHWMPTWWLAAAGILMAVWPHGVVMSSYLLSETLFGFLCALGLYLLRIALDRRSRGWAVASGVGLSLAALTNAVLLPFAPLLALYMLGRRQLSITMFSSLVAATLALTIPWAIRNALLPSSDSSSTGRALTNLVQGSQPLFQSAYQAAMAHDPGASAVLAANDQETAITQANPMAGLALIRQRMASHPGEYIRWYLNKPALLWSWSIRIGQGDFYVYPTRNSPFEINAAYRTVAAACHALNPWIFLLAIAGCFLALMPKQQANHGMAAASLMLLFVTVVYSLLQAEPRYSVPFRGLEIMLATFAVYRASRGMTRVRMFAKVKCASL